MERDFIDADAMYEARWERDETFDDFDSEVTCEEYYDEQEWDEPDVDEAQEWADYDPEC
jgi:hypothetical protein